MYQDRYAASIVAKYLDTTTIQFFHWTTLPNDMIFAKEYASNSDEQLEMMYIE